MGVCGGVGVGGRSGWSRWKWVVVGGGARVLWSVRVQAHKSRGTKA